jgi:SAM-dependent methyltransferase
MTPLMFSRSAKLYDAIYSAKDYSAETERLHTLIQERRPGASSLLDVACGTGMHLQLLRAHYEVQGLELDPAMLEVARARLPGVPVHQGDMVDADLGRTFDVVTCLFSSIGYVPTVEGLRRAVSNLARHASAGGMVVVEPWFSPETYHQGGVHALFVDEPHLKLARMNVSAIEGRTSVLEFEYLVGTPDGIERFTERHELGLFTDEEHREAFRAAGLEVEHDPVGLTDRGLYVGTKPA